MSPILLEPYRMKKKGAQKHPIRESEVPVTMAFMREFRAEIMSVLAEHTAQFKKIDARFEQIDRRFDAVDARFEQIDRRFDAVDARFEQMEKRFDAVDARFEEMEKRFDAVDARFEQMEKRFDAVDARFEEMNQRFDEVHARFDETDAKIERNFYATKADIHSVKVLCEEQNLRNRQAYDGYFWICEKVNQFEKRIKPECLGEE